MATTATVTTLTHAQGETLALDLAQPDGVDFSTWNFAAVLRAKRSSAAEAVLDLAPTLDTDDDTVKIRKDTVTLAPGTYFFDLRATDASGNDHYSPVYQLQIVGTVTGSNTDSTPS